MSTSLIRLGTDVWGEDWPRMRQMFDLHCGSMVSHLCDGSDGCVLFHRIQVLPTTALPSEHYTLLFDSGSGVIDLIFSDIQGLQAALVSLRQVFSPRGQVCTPTWAQVEIKDGPTHSWRGLMVDVARHFIPVAMIKRTIDAMTL